MGLSLNALLLISLLVLPVVSRQNYQRRVQNSPKGFDNQYKNVFKAYEKAAHFSKSHQVENVQEFDARFRTFAIPKDWFTHMFGPDQGPKYAREYRELFVEFESATIQEFNSLEGNPVGWGSSTQVKTIASGANQKLRWLTPTSLIPLPPVQRFRVRYLTGANFVIGENGCLQIISPGYSRYEMNSFIYVDGAFRLIGVGECPLWSACSMNE